MKNEASEVRKLDTREMQSMSIERLKICEEIKDLEAKAARLDIKMVSAGFKLSELAYR